MHMERKIIIFPMYSDDNLTIIRSWQINVVLYQNEILGKVTDLCLCFLKGVTMLRKNPIWSKLCELILMAIGKYNCAVTA